MQVVSGASQDNLCETRSTKLSGASSCFLGVFISNGAGGKLRWEIYLAATLHCTKYFTAHCYLFIFTNSNITVCHTGKKS